DEGAVPLPVDPGMVVVGDEGEGEPGLFRLAGEAHQRRRVVLFAGEGVSDLSHAVTPLPRTLTVDPPGLLARAVQRGAGIRRGAALPSSWRRPAPPRWPG